MLGLEPRYTTAGGVRGLRPAAPRWRAARASADGRVAADGPTDRRRRRVIRHRRRSPPARRGAGRQDAELRRRATTPRSRPADAPRVPTTTAGAWCDLERQAAAGAGVPAPPDHRRLRRRRVRLRRRPDRARRCCRRCARSSEQWFRVEVRGIENIPAERRRADRRQPLRHGAARRADDPGRRARRAPRSTGTCGCSAPTSSSRRRSSASWPARAARRWPATPTPSGCCGGGELVGVWPEGFKGIGKPFSERYKLQRFGRGGFVSAALRTGVPIIPCSIVGAEEIYPMLGNVPAARPAARACPTSRSRRPSRWLGPLGLVPLPQQVDHRVR